MNENPIIGFYCPNSEILPVYYDPMSQEVYYIDEQDNAYLLTGIELENHNPTGINFADMVTAAEERPDNVLGIVHDGAMDWVLTEDNTAHLVPAGSTNLTEAVRIEEIEDDMEYEPEEDVEDA